MVLILKSPRSFTGEDVIEIHCHGGLINVERVLQRVLSQPGVRRALPGEFSKRAVLNGRIDLTRAEAISQLIAARSQRAAQLAMTGLDGGIQAQINPLREHLLNQLSEIEARIDFEEDLPSLNQIEILSQLNKVKAGLSKLIDEANKGQLLHKGLQVALIGLPNVGKSSLLNRLSGRERAIVTSHPGTTRDLLESAIILQGVPITLLDTAGIRTTTNAIEKEGINRSHQALGSADVVVLIFDLSIGWSEADAALLNKIPIDIPKLIVGNKSDLKASPKRFPKGTQASGILAHITISALTGGGEKEFVVALLRACGASDLNGIVLALNDRQKDLAAQAIASLEKIQQTAENRLPLDFWTIDLREAIRSLGEITGEEVTEELLDRIFSRFCIGK